MIKKMTAWLFLVCFTGCASVSMPNYIQDKHPYKETFYAGFSEVEQAVTKTIEEQGWTVAKTADPSVFEGGAPSGDPESQQTLIFTEVRQTPLFLGSRYSRLNAYVRSGKNNVTEVELRYMVVTSVFFKKLHGYRKDQTVERIFKEIEKKLK